MHIVTQVGYLGLFVIVFFESFPLTFFLPGDSLLFTVGFLSSQNILNIWIAVPLIFLAGVLGYLFSYSLGQKIILKFFTDENARYFKPKYVRYTKDFYEKYGDKTLILGRFVPFVRSFAAALAGMVNFRYKKFVWYTLLGAAVWSVLVTTLGFYLGKLIPSADKYITPIVLAIIVISVLPSAWEYYKQRKNG